MYKNNFSLVINSSNVVNIDKNTYQYNFLVGSLTIPKDAVISVSSATIPYSMRNITVVNNNNTFLLYWPVGGIYNTYTVILPDGFYTIDYIQKYIEQFCITNGLYLINDTGAYVYYINLSLNISAYAVQIVENLIPTSLPALWTQPSNFAGYPTISSTMGLGVLNNNFKSIIGYSPANYPASFVSTSPQSFLSNITVNATPVNSLIIRCSLVSNQVVFPSDVLDAVPINTTYGSNIVYSPAFEKVVKIIQGTYSNFNIIICDQDNNPVVLLDSNLLITLRISF